MGIFGALWATAICTSGIKNSIKNSQCKELVKTLPNGIKYYTDVDGKHRLLSNDKIIFWTGYGNNEKVMDRNGNIYYDKAKLIKEDILKTEYSLSKKRKSLQLKYSDRCRCYVWIETKTGKQIAKLKNYNTDSYEIWYFYDAIKEGIRRRNPGISEYELNKITNNPCCDKANANFSKYEEHFKINREYWEQLYNDYKEILGENREDIFYNQGKRVHEIHNGFYNGGCHE